MLRIAVDVRPLSNAYNGIGRYLTEMLPRLIEGSDHQWALYSDQPIAKAQQWRTSFTRCANANSSLAGHWVAQRAFPAWAKKDRVDLFWSPRHQLPVRLDARIPTVVTLHDLVFETHPATMRPAVRWLDKLLTPASLKRADRIVTCLLYTSPSPRDRG